MYLSKTSKNFGRFGLNDVSSFFPKMRILLPITLLIIWASFATFNGVISAELFLNYCFCDEGALIVDSSYV